MLIGIYYDDHYPVNAVTPCVRFIGRLETKNGSRTHWVPNLKAHQKKRTVTLPDSDLVLTVYQVEPL